MRFAHKDRLMHARGALGHIRDGATENGDVTCKRADATPTLGDVRVGDRVKLACLNGMLTAIVKLDEPPVPPTVTTGGVGTISALAAGGITVHTDGADVTCRLTGDSRVPVEYHVGDFVRVSCTNGLLTAIARLDVKTITSGVLTALVDGNLTVLGDGGERSCKRGDASPSTDAFHVGDHVRMTCVNGTLTALEHL